MCHSHALTEAMGEANSSASDEHSSANVTLRGVILSVFLWCCSVALVAVELEFRCCVSEMRGLSLWQIVVRSARRQYGACEVC